MPQERPEADPASARSAIELRREAADAAREREELQQALAERPRRVPSRYFYDRRGSELFERITELPDYYLTRTERGLLETYAAEIAEGSGARVLVELGSGSARKTRILLDAMAAAGTLRRYVPVDVDEDMVRRVAAELTTDYPGLEVLGIVGDFVEHLPHLPAGGRRLVAFLGSTIGNFRPHEAIDFLLHIACQTAADDFLLLGFDLAKDRKRLEAAYNDAEGVTAEFNRNILRVVNQRFDGNFDPGAYDHLAFFNPAQSWIEMRLVSKRPQRVRLATLGIDLEIAAGEEILTEISTKFQRRGVREMLAAAGLEIVRWFTDPDDHFALVLAHPRPRA